MITLDDTTCRSTTESDTGSGIVRAAHIFRFALSADGDCVPRQGDKVALPRKEQKLQNQLTSSRLQQPKSTKSASPINPHPSAYSHVYCRAPCHEWGVSCVPGAPLPFKSWPSRSRFTATEKGKNDSKLATRQSSVNTSSA